MSGDEESSSYVAFERFETVMIRALTDQREKFVRDNEETILRAFRALDPNHQGFVEGDNLKKLLMSQGDAFDASEAMMMTRRAGGVAVAFTMRIFAVHCFRVDQRMPVLARHQTFSKRLKICCTSKNVLVRLQHVMKEMFIV